MEYRRQRSYLMAAAMCIAVAFCAARIRRVQKTGEGLLTALEHLRIVGLDLRHFRRVNLAVV